MKDRILRSSEFALKLKPKLFSPVVFRRAARIILIALVLAGICWMYFELRGYPFFRMPPIPAAEMTRLELHQLDVGIFLEMTSVPVLLLFLLAIIPSIRSVLQDQTAPHATMEVFVGLVAVQLLSQGFEMWTSHSVLLPVYTGFLVITMGSLLGGWRIGLSLGVISMFVQAAYDLVVFNHYVEEIQLQGFWQFLTRFVRVVDWRDFFYTKFAVPHISGGLWVALLACLSADLLGPHHRYSAVAAMGLQAGLVVAAGLIRLAADDPPGLMLVSAQALITSLAAGAVMLMIRNLQIEASKRKAEGAELMRVQAELRALRAQINPHFLFNALNTIVYMTRKDVETARRLLLDLSEVFQRTLRSGEFVPLRDELSYVEAYLSLEKARLVERLRVGWGGVLQPEAPLQTKTPLLDQLVPTLTLQPIVENAVIHGVGRKKEGGTVTITVGQLDPDLIVTVEDDGVGIDPLRLSEMLNPGKDNPACIGLFNVDKRLRLLYGEDHRLIIETESGHGTRVVIRIPMTKI
jgi:signal transduction histidine kinase